MRIIKLSEWDPADVTHSVLSLIIMQFAVCGNWILIHFVGQQKSQQVDPQMSSSSNFWWRYNCNNVYSDPRDHRLFVIGHNTRVTSCVTHGGIPDMKDSGSLSKRQKLKQSLVNFPIHFVVWLDCNMLCTGYITWSDKDHIQELITRSVHFPY